MFDQVQSIVSSFFKRNVPSFYSCSQEIQTCVFDRDVTTSQHAFLTFINFSHQRISEKSSSNIQWNLGRRQLPCQTYFYILKTKFHSFVVVRQKIQCFRNAIKTISKVIHSNTFVFPFKFLWLQQQQRKNITENNLYRYYRYYKYNK